MRLKNLYEAPETEVLELRLEGVIAISESNITTDYGEGWNDQSF